MIRTNIIGILICISLSGYAQNGPVEWSFSAIRLQGANGKEAKYEVRIVASIPSGWHLYSQEQPKSFIGRPTSIKFSQNPLIKLLGRVDEIGELEKKKDNTIGVESWEYSNRVEFVQEVKVRNGVKTNVNGSIEFQVCTDERCLPPATREFSIKLE